ncbi:ABC transporter permease [Actinomadura decatromicini]|uniref:ABC transporter permease n=1 Tax=Actinomadura decatromicini TaxID=2604572 RepID=A0A5D3F4S0_9ACTN|nr:ABC transporter permease [Actinomadura decatromicini]TYK42796.1 ABC transporter permease [Actinomadura decatromicini]
MNGRGAADAVAAEWWKLRSVRSTYWVLTATALTLGLVLLLSVQVAHAWDGLSAADRARFELRPLQETGGWAAGPGVGVLGVLAITPEYRTGMIRTTFTAVPPRGVLLAAKAVVVGTVALVAGEAVTVGSLAGTRLVVGDRRFADQGASLAHELPGFAVVGATPAVYALLGLALGALLRSAAGSIVSLVFAWHVLPLLVYHLPGPWNERLGSVMIGGLPARIAGRDAEDSIYGDLLPPGAAAALLAAYAVVPLVLAAAVLRRRDA